MNGKYNLYEFENIEVGEELLDSFDLENLSLESVMFQSGYLTIREIEEFGDNYLYHLHYPNLEVKKSFNDLKYLYLSSKSIVKEH